ncbi:hypothetical protein X975_22449, partial [Stegodyphus mimosarum]
MVSKFFNVFTYAKNNKLITNTSKYKIRCSQKIFTKGKGEEQRRRNKS